MKNFLAKQMLKIVCSLILFPVVRFVLIPALMPKTPDGASVTSELDPASPFSGTHEFAAVPVGSRLSDRAQKQLQEAARRMNSGQFDGSVQKTITRGTTTTANKPASQPSSKTDMRNRQSRVAEVQGHKILINPAKTSVNSVIISPGSTSPPSKCPPRKT